MTHLLSSNTYDMYFDMKEGVEKSSISPYLDRHAESGRLIAEGITNYSIPLLKFLTLSKKERKNLDISFKKNIELNEELLSRKDVLPRDRYEGFFSSALFEEFPDKGLFKSCLYAYFKLRARYPLSAYAVQIAQSYFEYAFFAYGVYFETGGRVLSLRSFENLLEGFDRDGVLFTDAIKLYKLQTFIEKSAKGQSPYYDSERSSFESSYEYIENDFRCIPSERIFPMEKYDPQDWKAALLPLKYSKKYANEFRAYCKKFIEDAPEIDDKIVEKEYFRFQNVSCALSKDPAKSGKLREEVRQKYEMFSEPFQFKRTLINVSTSNYRDSWINTPESRKTCKHFELLARKLIRNIPEIPDGDMENDGYITSLRTAPDRVYVMGDIKKWGLTFPIYLLRIFCEEAEKRFPFGWTQLAYQYENSWLHIGDERIKIGTRGFGLGNLNYISSIIHYIILKMTNCEKFIVRSDDSLAVYKPTQNPFYEIYLKEKLGFIVNRKKINISSIANVFCENYVEVEAKFRSQLYEKLGFMTAQIGSVMRKVCNSTSCKFYIRQASELPLPAKSLVDFLVSLTYHIFGPEFGKEELMFDPECGGWTKKYYSTNLKSEYIAFEEDLEAFPDYANFIKTIYKAKLHPKDPASLPVKKRSEYYPLLKDKLFVKAGAQKEMLERDQNLILPIETPYDYIERVNEQLGCLTRLNKNPRKRHHKWKQLAKYRKRVFNKVYAEISSTEESARHILLERIKENYEKGKGGYAIPYLIFENNEGYDYNAHAISLNGTYLAENTYVHKSQEKMNLQEEDTAMAEFLKCAGTGKVPAKMIRFNLWPESKDTFSSLSDYGTNILINNQFKEIIRKNEKFLAVFNIPTEIAYLDWSHRQALKSESPFYLTNFSFEMSEKKLLYDPNLYKRKTRRSGEDPALLKLYGVEFLVHKEEFKIISHGLKLMKHLPEYEDVIDELFNYLYEDGILSPAFLMARDDLISELEEQRIISSQDAARDLEEDEVLLELLAWKPDASSLEYEEEGIDIIEQINSFINKKPSPLNEEEELEISKIDSIFEAILEDEPIIHPPEVDQPSDEEFDFSYDYESE